MIPPNLSGDTFYTQKMIIAHTDYCTWFHLVNNGQLNFEYKDMDGKQIYTIKPTMIQRGLF